MRIELRNVSKRFGPATALAGVDLTIESGARVALLGPNGSGKTTLTRALMGLIRHEGEILIDGRRLTDRMAVAARLAYVPQIAPQIAAPVDEVVRAITSLRGIDRRRVRDLAAELGLDLDRIGARPVRTLSGGMRQKLLLALALATPADLLVLDEPTASLDAQARARFLARVADTAGGATLVLCSHRLDELRALVDHVVALAEGQVTYDGPAAAYLAARQAAVIELRYRGPDAAWLTAHGFTRGLGGWWSRAVSQADKLRLVPAALAILGAAVDDLVVRDSDRVEPEVAHAA